MTKSKISSSSITINSNDPRSRSKSRSWKAVLIALYITFILLSTIPFVADRAIEPSFKDSYTHHLRYRYDGRQTHYYVERINTSEIGKIDLTYTTASNSLNVKTENIKVLHVYCRSLYEDECRDVYGIDPEDNSNYYKWYFIEKNHFNVNIDSDSEIEELSFIDTPFAHKVVVNGNVWTESKDYTYNNNQGIALSTVPKGNTRVDLYFKPASSANIPPTAILSASETLVPIKQTITFDASQSYDVDGKITTYVMDLGDGTYLGGSKNEHYYSKPGVYGVILLVRDDDDLIDHAYVNITVVDSTDIPEIQNIVPDQEKPEDSPPWMLELGAYEPFTDTAGLKFNWYLTGEDTSLYSVVGENSSDDKLIFTPVRDAYGSDLVILWLKSTENISVSQPLWINITPVNDNPTISGIPDLIIHYDDDYTFNYAPYVNDIETPNEELILTVYDGSEDKHITISGLNATFNYPQKLVGEIIYATVSVSDGEGVGQDVITIQVTSDYVPKLIKELPDLWILEGTTKLNVFDLDDYFTDPDDDSIFFSTGQSHLDIVVKNDHTVDISAYSEWTGVELVTFRARDPIGAIAEDMIFITVLPVNDAPSISNVPNLVVHYDKNYRFDLTPFVHDNDNTTKELRITTSDPENIKIDQYYNMIIIINYPIEYIDETISVRLTVSDGQNQDFQDIIVTVADDHPPELISPLPDIIFLEDMSLMNAFDLDSHFLDIDGNALYSYFGNNYINIIINNDHTVDVSAPQDWHGTENVYFRINDPSGALQQDLVLVTVLPVNDAPILLPIPDQDGNESERWILELEPFIFDVDNNVSELEIFVDNENVVVSGSSLIFLGSKEMPKEVQVSVSDSEYTATQGFKVHVKLDEPPRAVTFMDLFMNLLPFIIIIIIIVLVIVVLVHRKRSKFTTDEVFLIHTGGTLITHLTRNQQANIDDVIFSGMFTAVQEFIKDTFADTGMGNTANDKSDKDQPWLLDELKLGDSNVLIERSENTYLAVIFTGPGSKPLRKIVKELLAEIENKYAKILPKWSGNIRELEGTKPILSVLIEVKEEPVIKEKPPVAAPPATKPTPIPIPSSPPVIRPQAPLVPQPQPQPQQTVRSVESKNLATAHAIQIQTSKPASVELLSSTGKQLGAGKPGLSAWQMTPASKQIENTRPEGINNEKLPIGMHINSKSQPSKTVAISKNPIPLTAKPAPIVKRPPHGLDGTTAAKPVTVTMPGSKKPLLFDPNKSLLRQMAEMDG